MKTDGLQQAIYDRLVSQVGGSVAGIYTDVPQAPESEDLASFPYITISGIAGNPNDTKTDNGMIALVDVHIWSRSRSSLTWRGIADQVYDALQKYDALVIPGANVVDCRFDSSAEFEDPDGVTKHHISTFRVNYRA